MDYNNNNNNSSNKCSIHKDDIILICTPPCCNYSKFCKVCVSTNNKHSFKLIQKESLSDLFNLKEDVLKSLYSIQDSRIFTQMESLNLKDQCDKNIQLSKNEIKQTIQKYRNALLIIESNLEKQIKSYEDSNLNSFNLFNGLLSSDIHESTTLINQLNQFNVLENEKETGLLQIIDCFLNSQKFIQDQQNQHFKQYKQLHDDLDLRSLKIMERDFSKFYLELNNSINIEIKQMDTSITRKQFKVENENNTFTLYAYNGEPISEDIKDIAILSDIPISSLPSHIKSLYIHNGYKLEINQIPPNVKFLILGNIEREIQPGAIPDTVTDIHFLDDFNQPLGKGVLPETTKALTFANINTVLSKHSIPKNTISICFVNGFKQKITKELIPNSVRQIFFYTIAQPLENSLPDTVGSISLFKGFNHSTDLISKKINITDNR